MLCTALQILITLDAFARCSSLSELGISQDMQPRLMRRESSTVSGSPFVSHAKSHCPWLDGHDLLEDAPIEVHEPTVIRNVLDGASRRALAHWSERGVFKKFGHSSVNSKYLGGNACGFVGKSNESTLAEILSSDCAGNTFLQRDHDISRTLNARLLEAVSSSPLRRLLKWQQLEADQLSGHVSIGYKTQWNRVHRHELTLFVQVKGHKGWVFIPHESIPSSLISPRDRHWNLVSDGPPLDRDGLCEVFAEDLQAKKLQGQYHGTRMCEVHEGEALLFPANWWHGTCNLGRWNAGVAFTADPLHEKHVA